MRFVFRIPAALATFTIGVSFAWLFWSSDDRISRPVFSPAPRSAAGDPADFRYVHLPEWGTPRLAMPGAAVTRDEISKTAELEWLGLFPAKDGTYELRDIRVTLDPSPLGVEIPGAPLKWYSVSGGARPLFMIKNVARTAAGPVETWFDALDAEARNAPIDLGAFVPSFGFKGTEYDFSKLGREVLAFKSFGVRGVYLSAPDKHQALYLSPPRLSEFRDPAAEGYDPENVVLKHDFDKAEAVWLGDLDGDKGLDVLIRFSRVKATGDRRLITYVLYTSGMADAHQIVAPAAVFEALSNR